MRPATSKIARQSRFRFRSARAGLISCFVVRIPCRRHEQSVYEEAQVGDKHAGRILVRGNAGDIPLDKNVTTITGDRFQERVTPHTSVGVIYVFILVLTILITTVPLRGVASLVAIVTI